jgi:hypothetical protein
MRIKYIIFIAAMLGIVGLGSVYSLLNTTKNTAATQPVNTVVAVNTALKATFTKTATIQEVTKGPKITLSNTANTGNASIASSDSSWINSTTQTIQSQANNLSATVLKASLTAYLKAEKLGLNPKQVLTIVDYSLPSTERRLWVIDMKNLKVLFNTWVAHGTNSGGATPTSFSNQPSSLKSSLGVFITDAPYTGGKGYSLRIRGLEHNFNDNAYNRSIVFHGAWYVSSNFAKARGMMGRSWGCFAVDNKVIKSLVNTIKEKSLVVAYYPDKNWMRYSKFIN